MIKQISILLENEVGAIYEVTNALTKAKVSIKAFSVFDTSSFGILRLLVEDDARAEEVLKNQGFGYIINDVLAVELNDEVGALNQVIKILTEGGFNINYMYSMVIQEENPLMVIDVNQAKEAGELLKEKGVKSVDME